MMFDLQPLHIIQQKHALLHRWLNSSIVSYRIVDLVATNELSRFTYAHKYSVTSTTLSRSKQ